MVAFIRNHDAAGHAGGQRAERRPVRDIARGEEQRGLLVVKVGELALKQDVLMAGARNIARAAGASARSVDRLMHGGEHFGMLAHAEIIVGAPHGHFPLAAGVMEPGFGEGARDALELGEHAIAALAPERIELILEEGVVIHDALPLLLTSGYLAATPMAATPSGAAARDGA